MSTSDSKIDDTIVENEERVKCSNGKSDKIGAKNDSMNQTVPGTDSNEPPLNGWQLAKMKKSIPDMSLP